MGDYSKYRITDNSKLFHIDNKEPDVSYLESALRGGAQGLTSGFADEIESLITRKKLDDVRQAYKQAEEANPITYNVSDVGGGIGQLALLGGVGKGVPLLAGAAQGAIEGIGRSEDKSIGDAVAGGTIGAAIPAAGMGISKLYQKIAEKAKPVVQEAGMSALSHLTGKSKEGLQAYKEAPEIINKLDSLGTVPEIQTKLAEGLEGYLQNSPYQKKAKELSKQSFDILEKSGVTVNPEKAIFSLDDKIKKLGSEFYTSDKSAEAKKALTDFQNSLYESSQKFGGELPAVEVKKAIQQFDEQTAGKYGDVVNDVYANAIKDFRKTIDSELKTKVPEYRDIMQEISKYTALDQRLQKKYLTDKMYDADKIGKSLMNEKSIKNQRDISRLSDSLADDGRNLLGSELQGKRLADILGGLQQKKAFDAQTNQGSNIVNYFQGLGAGVGSLPGYIAGSVAGRYMEKNAGTIAKKAIDFIRPVQDIEKRVTGSKYEGLIKNAIQGGARKAAVTHYLLAQTKPDYRELINGEGE